MTSVSAMEAAGRDSNPLRKIGQGQCGSVWASSTRGPAFKREDGGPGRSLENDFEMHQRILRSFQRVCNLPEGWNGRIKAPSAHIPACHTFIGMENQDWWSFESSKISIAIYDPVATHSAIHREKRELLLDTYCCPSEEDHALRDEILMSEPSKDCIIRPYQDRRRWHHGKSFKRLKPSLFSLRNFSLHLDQIQGLGIPPSDIRQYASIMVETLAVMHWIGEIDANDIEFVLAPVYDEGKLTKPGIITNVLGDHGVWVLDFDLCRTITMDEKGTRQAINVFWGNDRY